MAEVDFGDTELFEQLDDSAPPVPKHIRFSEEEGDEEVQQLRSRLGECEDNMQRLAEENKVLRRKLNILTRPSGVTIEDVLMDGPLLQILYTNNFISKQCRQEIEDGVCSVVMKQQKLLNEKKPFHIKPQNSALALEEDPLTSSSNSVKTTAEAFKVVGSVLYFSTFSVDKLGQPLVNENPKQTDGWELPTYLQIFSQIVGTEGQDIEMRMKDKRPKSMCFNCGDCNHQLKDCPKPKNMAAINERRKEFNQNSQPTQGNQRYHADEMEERFAKFKPGVMSAELLSALGVDGNTLPPLIYRMRLLGYPPGWLKEAEMEDSGLMLYDGNASNNGGTTEDSQNSSYDVSKLVDFPGFNVPTPDKMKDEFSLYGSIPIQSTHMKNNYAAYLSSSFPMPGASSNKRRHESDSSPQLKKRTKPSPDHNSSRSSDMDIESDPGTPYINSPGNFQFQPPLPPGSPSFSSPPPLPQGTPPATPTPPPLPKGTPPVTPNNGSPALRGQSWSAVDETVEGTDDDVTLEELEEQQRRIWAALQNADTASNSDCETPAMGTPVPSSPSVSSFALVDTDVEEVDDTPDSMAPAETCHGSENQREKEVQAVSHQSCGLFSVKEDSPHTLGSVKAENDGLQIPSPIKVEEDSPRSPGPIKVEEDSPRSPGPIKVEEDSPQSPDADNRGAEDSTPLQQTEKVTAVPHRSRFAAGIVPFEDTPEFTEVAEATGTYLKIRDLLKSSPRNLSKNK